MIGFGIVCHLKKNGMLLLYKHCQGNNLVKCVANFVLLNDGGKKCPPNPKQEVWFTESELKGM